MYSYHREKNLKAGHRRRKRLFRKNLENPKCLMRERHEMSSLHKIYITGETPSRRPPL